MTLGERAINLVFGRSIAKAASLANNQQVQALAEMIFGRPQLSLLMARTRYDYQSQVGNGLSSAVVMGPILWVARNFPESPIRVKHRTPGAPETDELVDSHPMVALIHRPNPFYSGRTLWMATMISWTLDGNAYWMKIRNGAGQVIQLWYVPHWMVRPEQTNATDYVTHYRYTPGGRTMLIPTSEIVHFRYGLDPENIMKGYAPLKSLYREIFTDDEAANFSAALLKNSGVPGIVLAPKDGSTSIAEEDAKTMKERLRNTFTGDMRGDPFVATQPLELSKFAWSPEELDMSVMRNVPEERVCAVLGIPAAVVGFGSGLAQTKVGATMEQLEKQAYKNNVIPSQKLMAEELDNQLLGEFERSGSGRYSAFDNGDVACLQDDKDALHERVIADLAGGLLTRAEARHAVGLESTPDDDVYYMSSLIVEVPVGQSFEQVLAARPTKPAAPPVQAGEAVPKDAKGQRARRLELKLSRREAQYLRKLRADAVHQQSAFADSLKARFERMGEEAAALYRSHEPVTAGRNGNGRKGPMDPSPNAGSDQILITQILALMNLKPLDYKPHYLMIAKATVAAMNEYLGVGLNLTDDVEKRIVAAGGKRQGLVDLSGQAKQDMFDALAEGRAAGDGADAMAQRIRDKVSAGPWSTSEVRAQVIARTETKYAQGISAIEASKDGAGIAGMTMVDAQLGPTDEECEMINGEEVSFEEAEQLMAEEHPNGTRSCIPRMGEE